MAEKTIVTYKSDLSDEEYTPGETGETVPFSLDGKSYEVDVTTEEGAKFRDLMALYVASARRVHTTPAKSKAPAKGGNSDVQEARAWLLEQGHAVKAKGRIPADLMELYRASQKGVGVLTVTAPILEEAEGWSCDYCDEVAESEEALAIHLDSDHPGVEGSSDEEGANSDNGDTPENDTPVRDANVTELHPEVNDEDVVAWFEATGKAMTTTKSGGPDSAARRKYRRHHGLTA